MPTIGGLVVVSTGVEAAGRRALIDVVDELSRSVDASDVTVRAIAGDAFRAAVNIMNRKGLWPWEILNETISMFVANAFSTATGNIKEPLAMHYLSTSNSNPNQRVGYTRYDRFMEKFSLDVAGEPHSYTVPNLFETSQIRWFPIPSQNRSLNFTYYRATPAPHSDQETIEIPEYAIEAYMAFAWLEFVKRIPARQQPFPPILAAADAKQAFRELSHRMASSGDRTREINVNQGWGYGT